MAPVATTAPSLTMLPTPAQIAWLTNMQPAVIRPTKAGVAQVR